MMIPSSTIDAMVQEQNDRLEAAKRDADTRVALLLARLEATNELLKDCSPTDYKAYWACIAANAAVIKQARNQ